MVDREYEYQLKAGRIMMRALLYGAGAIFFAYMAMTNDQGLILFVIPLSTSNATGFYGFAAVLAAFFSVFDAVNAERRGKLRQRIAFTEDGLLVPLSKWSTEEVCIPYESIVKLEEIKDPNSFVLIEHENGVFSLRLDMLPNERAYGEVFQYLSLLHQAAKSGADRHPSAARKSESA